MLFERPVIRHKFKFLGVCFTVKNENVTRGMLAIFNMENNNGEISKTDNGYTVTVLTAKSEC